jgi:hypothetical protein
VRSALEALCSSKFELWNQWLLHCSTSHHRHLAIVHLILTTTHPELLIAPETSPIHVELHHPDMKIPRISSSSKSPFHSFISPESMFIVDSNQISNNCLSSPFRSSDRSSSAIEEAIKSSSGLAKVSRTSNYSSGAPALAQETLPSHPLLLFHFTGASKASNKACQKNWCTLLVQ